MDYYSKYINRFKKESKVLKSQSMANRKEWYNSFFDEVYDSFKKERTSQVLSDMDARGVALAHSDWMDDWMKFTWDFVRQEEELLMADLMKTANQKKVYLEGSLPQKLAKKSDVNKLLSDDESQQVRMDPAERAYFNNQLAELNKEISEMRQELKILNEITPMKIEGTSSDERLQEVCAVFARGGFGRKELTFSSDIDLAYCIDPSISTSLEIQIFQELVKRMEDLFQGIDLDVASQYFELSEDLSRFSRTDMLHSIPSILEGRLILGSQSILDGLKDKFLGICPVEKILRYLLSQMESLKKDDTSAFDIKESFGGIRHIQFVLWMVLIIETREQSNSEYLIDFMRKAGWISENDKQNLINALEFYFDLRNFIGHFHYLQNDLEKTGYEPSYMENTILKDQLVDSIALAYLKLKKRFITIDFLDRFRLHSMQIISKLSQSIVATMLNRTVAEDFDGFTLYKHFGSNQILRFETSDTEVKTSWNLSVYAEEKAKSEKERQDELVGKLFSIPENLFDLFIYIARTGYYLSESIKDGFTSLVSFYRQKEDICRKNGVKDFVFNLFIAENASVAIEQMMEIAAPLEHDGQIKTLLGLFIPEVNQMRYLLRNIEVHEFPLCIHSQKALSQVEKEIEVVQKKEPELWRFISERDVFALKWSTLFHDIGKINPYKDHEKLGPILATEMLTRLGWDETDEVFDLVRLLVAHHQSIVRFTQLSTYLDLGIQKFFDLAQRDPGKVVMLYLINLSDFKSVNSQMNKKSAHLESFFERTLGILSEFKQNELQGSLTEIVNNNLDRKVNEIRRSVLIELLLRQCCNKSLEDIILNPLSKKSPQAVEKLNQHRNDLDNSIVFLKLAELDTKSLEKHRIRFTQIVDSTISEEDLFSLVSPYNEAWNWFFTSIPNRYLLGSSVEVLTSQLQEFEGDLNKKIKLSYIKGDRGEHDSLLFHFYGSVLEQAKIAYVLSWQGVNIENGKINKVVYQNGKEGFVGFLRVSTKNRSDRLTTTELQNVIENLVIPPLNPPPVSVTKKLSKVNVEYLLEKEKGYKVNQISNDQFKRFSEECVSVKISLFDAPFVYYKIIRSFEAIGVMPQQITITTIGNQIIDYFYVTKQEREKLKKGAFNSVLQKYINAEITIT